MAREQIMDSKLLVRDGDPWILREMKSSVSVKAGGHLANLVGE